MGIVLRKNDQCSGVERSPFDRSRIFGIHYPRRTGWVLREADEGLQDPRGKVDCRVSEARCEGCETYAYFSACFTAALGVTVSAAEYPTAAGLSVMVIRTTV